MGNIMPNVIVTGGRRGIGLGIARMLTGAGYSVIAIARQETAELTSAIGGGSRSNSGSLHFVPFDLAKIDEIPKLVRTLRTDFGPIYPSRA